MRVVGSIVAVSTRLGRCKSVVIKYCSQDICSLKAWGIFMCSRLVGNNCAKMVAHLGADSSELAWSQQKTIRNLVSAVPKLKARRMALREKEPFIARDSLEISVVH